MLIYTMPGRRKISHQALKFRHPQDMEGVNSSSVCSNIPAKSKFHISKRPRASRLLTVSTGAFNTSGATSYPMKSLLAIFDKLE
jgi:hypothetical protein